MPATPRNDPPVSTPTVVFQLRRLPRLEAVWAAGFGATALFLMAPAFLDAVDGLLGIATGGRAFRFGLRALSQAGIVALAWMLLRPARDDERVVFGEEAMSLDVARSARVVDYRDVTAAHRFESASFPRVVVGVRGRLPLTVPTASLGGEAEEERFLATLRERVEARSGRGAAEAFDSLSALGAATATAGMPFTVGFVALAIVGFLVGLATGVQEDPLGFLRFGAFSSAMVRSGEYERMLSHVFVHWNAMHLWANVSTLIAVGFSVERLLGWRVYSVLLFSASLFTAASGFFSPAGVLRIGASGTVSAALGILFWLNLRRPSEMPPLAAVPSRLWLFLLLAQLGLMLAWLAAGAPSIGIDHAAHAWGWMMGAAVAAVAVSGRSIAELRAMRPAWLRLGSTCAIVAMALAVALSSMRAIGFGEQDRARAGLVLLDAPETPASVRQSLVEAFLGRPVLEGRELYRALSAARAMVREDPYTAERHLTLATVSLRLGREKRAFAATREAMVWASDRIAAARAMGTVLASARHDGRRRPLLFGPRGTRVSLRFDGESWWIRADAPAKVRERGLLVFAELPGLDPLEPRGLVVFRLGRGFAPETEVRRIPAWVHRSAGEVLVGAVVGSELVHVEPGRVEVEAIPLRGDALDFLQVSDSSSSGS